MDLRSIESFLLDHRIKGVPGGIEPFPISRIGEKRWNVLREDLPLPLAILKESALAHNGTWDAPFPGPLRSRYRAARQDDHEPAAIRSAVR